MSELQDTMWEGIFKDFGLERGEIDLTSDRTKKKRMSVLIFVNGTLHFRKKKRHWNELKITKRKKQNGLKNREFPRIRGMMIFLIKREFSK